MRKMTNLFYFRECNECRYGKQIVKSRLSYIEDIACNLECTPQYFPTPDEEKLYQEALGHVVHVLSSKRYPMPKPDTLSAQVDKWTTRENCMIEILNKLHYLERRRLYDPPSNNEIGYYRLIKKYVISIAAFFDSRCDLSVDELDLRGKRFSCFSPFQALQYVEEFGEVYMYLTHISDYVLEVNIENLTGDNLKPLLGVNMSTAEEVSGPQIHWGRQRRNNKFYHHKFQLAFMDLRSSYHSMSPPNPEEKTCYEQLLTLIVPPSSTSKSEANVYLDNHLLDVFEERLLADIRSLEKLSTVIVKDILMNLSFPMSWETVNKHRVRLRYLNHSRTAEDHDVNFQRELLDKCQISNENLPNYIEDVGRCVQLMCYIYLLINSVWDLKYEASELTKIDFIYKLPRTIKTVEGLGWEALHALTLVTHSSRSSVVVNGSGKRTFLQKCNAGIPDISFDPCCMEQPPAKKAKVIGFNNNGKADEDENEKNVEMLKGILTEFREIENRRWEPPSTAAERQVINKICQSVVSSTHLFTCTLAYEQMTHVIHHHPIDAHTRKPIERVRSNANLDFPSEFKWGLYANYSDIRNFLLILRGFMNGLQGKLNKLEE